jgi:hypothetical protein
MKVFITSSYYSNSLCRDAISSVNLTAVDKLRFSTLLRSTALHILLTCKGLCHSSCIIVLKRFYSDKSRVTYANNVLVL